MEDLKKHVIVYATAPEIFDAWTTEDGLRTFFSENVHMELKEGGPFEIYFSTEPPEGLRGSEGCKVLSWEEDKRLTFSWNFPPSLPEIRDERTEVTIAITPLDGGGGCEVSLRQSGFQDEGQWPDGYAYFDRAWDMVLENLRASFMG